jgi:hypothetical protein
MKQRALAVLLLAATAACGADREFDRIVSAIEHHYGVKRTHIPLMGLANLFVKVARPAGTSSFKLAVFEDLPPAAGDGDGDRRELDRLMDEISSGGLHAIIVTHSRRDEESTYILAGEIGKSSKLLIATFGRREATVIEARVDLETLLQMIGSPDEAHRMFQTDRTDRDER